MPKILGWWNADVGRWLTWRVDRSQACRVPCRAARVLHLRVCAADAAAKSGSVWRAPPWSRLVGVCLLLFVHRLSSLEARALSFIAVYRA